MKEGKKEGRVREKNIERKERVEGVTKRKKDRKEGRKEMKEGRK